MCLPSVKITPPPVPNFTTPVSAPVCFINYTHIRTRIHTYAHRRYLFIPRTVLVTCELIHIPKWYSCVYVCTYGRCGKCFHFEANFAEKLCTKLGVTSYEWVNIAALIQRISHLEVQRLHDFGKSSEGKSSMSTQHQKQSSAVCTRWIKP